MGRPPKSPEERASERVMVYMTPNDREFLRRICPSNLAESQMLLHIFRQYLLQHFKEGLPMEYPASDPLRGADLTGSLNGADLVYQKPVAVTFNCELKDESWEGRVSWVTAFGSHWQFNVQGRGNSFTVIVGETISGWFLAIPGEGVCLDLGSPTDTFYNEEQVLRCTALNRVDGITAVQAFKALYEAGHIRDSSK